MRTNHIQKLFGAKFGAPAETPAEPLEWTFPEQPLEYVDAATNVNADTRHARIVDLYRYLREHDNINWYKDQALRQFLTETVYENPYIPSAVREREFLSRSQPTLPRKFIDVWDTEGLPRELFIINPNDLEAAFRNVPDIIEAFKKSNVHDTSYYFTKLSEWLITLGAIETQQARTVLDVGAAYHGFAQVAVENNPNVHITMLDLVFAPGRSKFRDRIDQIGSDAGDMQMVEDNSIDLVCAHNALEHFCGDADTHCIREVVRVLKPGGRMLITPIFFDERTSLSINPFSCFGLAQSNFLENAILEEIEDPNVRIDFRPNIISPYSRRYDYDTLMRRLVEAAPELEVKLVTPVFKPDGFNDGVFEREIFGLELQQNIYDRRIFHCLELELKE